MTFQDPTSSFPSSTASRSDILLTANRQTFSLSSNISDSDDAIPVNEDLTTSNVPNEGVITINDERIKYTNVDTTNDQFTSTTRGFDGSSAASHSSGDVVDMNITAFNINRQAQEIIDIQGELGTSPSGSAADVDTRIGNLESPSYVSVSAETALDNERTLNGSTAITLTDNGAGNNLDVAVSTGSITASLLDESTSPTWTGTHDFSGGSFIFPTASAPSPTTEGQAVWDSDDDELKVGDGVSTKTVQPFVQADYVTITTDSGLDNERTLNAGTNLSLTDNGANSNVTLDVDDAFVQNTGDTIAGSLTYDTGANTNAVVDEDGIDRSSSSSETFNVQNSGAGSITLQQDGTAVVLETRTLTGGNAIDAIGDLSQDRTIAVSSNSIQTDELDLSIAPTWTGTHTWDTAAGTNAALDETGFDRSSSSAETWTIQNSGTGSMELRVSDTLSLDGGTTSIDSTELNLLDGMASKTGTDSNFATGTAGTSGNLAEWNADGDLVDSGTATSNVLDASGTPADNQLGVWVDSNTLEGDTNLTWDGSTFTVTSGDINIASGLLETDQSNSRVIIGGPTSDPGNTAVDSNEVIFWFDDSNDKVKFRAEDAGGQQLTGTLGSGGGNVSNVGTPQDNELAVWTGSTTIEGDDNLTWDGSVFRTTDYEITASTNWEIQSRSSATDAQYRFFAQDGDGTDSVQARVYAVGTPDSVTDSEFASLEWDSSANVFKLRSTSTGTGSDRDIRIEAAATSNQFVARTDGNVALANSLRVGSTGAASDTLDVDGAANISGNTTFSSNGGNIVLAQSTADYTVQWNDPSAARTYTLPDAGANADFLLTEGSQTINGAHTHTSNVQLNDDVQLQLGSASGGDWIWEYESANTRVRLHDGTNDLLRVDDGTTTVDFPNAINVTGASTLGGDATFGTATQDYLLSNNGAELTLRAQSANTLSRVNLEAQTADGGDDVDLRTFAVGTAGGTDTESLRVGYDAGGTEYLVASEAAGTGSHRPIKIESGGNTNQLVAATDGNVGIGTDNPSFPVHAVATGGSTQFQFESDSAGFDLKVKNTGTGIAQMIVDGASGSDSEQVFEEGGTQRYKLGYVSGNTRFRLLTQDSDGGGTSADVIRIPDGQVSIDGNGSFDDNAFDYVCEDCGWHTVEWKENHPCPECGGHNVEWHDDLEFADEVVHSGRNFQDMDEDTREKLEKLGLVQFDEEDGTPFISFQKNHLFSLSAHAQAHRRIEKLEKQNEMMKSALEQIDGVEIPDEAAA